MTKSSYSAVDFDDGSDVEIEVPRATELLLKIKRPNDRMSWSSVLGGLIFVAWAVVSMAMSGELGMTFYIFGGAALSCFLGDEWKRQKERQKMMVDLLEALVAQNNQFRRELERLTRSKA